MPLHAFFVRHVGELSQPGHATARAPKTNLKKTLSCRLMLSIGSLRVITYTSLIGKQLINTRLPRARIPIRRSSGAMSGWPKIGLQNVGPHQSYTSKLTPSMPCTQHKTRRIRLDRIVCLLCPPWAIVFFVQFPNPLHSPFAIPLRYAFVPSRLRRISRVGLSALATSTRISAARSTAKDGTI